jgi:hypothetical protein
MTLTIKLFATAVALVLSSTTVAAISQQEADQLGGDTLTEFGAEKAGNAEGTIPAYTGGLPRDTAPPGWKAGSGRYDHNPYEDEKPLFSINAANMDKYADKLTVGAIALMKKYPDYRIDIYPTHRSVGYSAEWLSHCKTNAITVKLTESGDGVIGGHECIPFPIPKTGMEVQWNAQLRHFLDTYNDVLLSNWLVDGNGHITDIAHLHAQYLRGWLNPATQTMPDSYFGKNVADWLGPPSQVGTKILLFESINYDKDGALGWFYSPGQRRTRLAPEFSYDTPVGAYGGAIFYDEQYGFNGDPDRFDWTLVGKKEIYVPYNSYAQSYAPIEKIAAGKGFINPDFNRYELHRVWVVDSKLKPGKRHAYSRRTFYIDEDSWAIVASDSYDGGGKLYRAGFIPLYVMWDKQSFYEIMNFYDLSKSGYLMGPTQSRAEDYLRLSDDITVSTGTFTADSLAGRGVR